MRQLIFLFLCVAIHAVAFGQSPQSTKPTEQLGDTGKNGTLVVLMTWDDAYTTPTTGAYVEAHSFEVKHVSERSFVLKMLKAGRYEAVLPPGVYDVFVSEATSTPRCRRVLINPGSGQLWKLMLEHDDVYLQR